MTNSERKFITLLSETQNAIREGEWTHSKNENRAVRIFDEPDARLLLRKAMHALDLLMEGSS
jgi:hypothetical protein